MKGYVRGKEEKIVIQVMCYFLKSVDYKHNNYKLPTLSGKHPMLSNLISGLSSRTFKQYTVSRRLSGFQSCASRYPSGRDVGKEERSFLSTGESRTGPGAQSFERNPDSQQEVG